MESREDIKQEESMRNRQVFGKMERIYNKK